MDKKTLVCLVLSVAAVASCGEATAPVEESRPALEVRIMTAAEAGVFDGDGYSVEISGAVHPVAVSDTLAIDDLAAGRHSVTLTGLAANCSVLEPNPQPVDIGASTVTVVVTFHVICQENTGTLHVSTITTGAETDPDGFHIAVVVDGQGPVLIVDKHINGQSSHLIRAGIVRVQLQGVARNCVVTGGFQQTVTITHAAFASVTFETRCQATNSIQFTTSTTGVLPHTNGYYGEIRRNNNYIESFQLPSQGVRQLAGLVPGEYQVRIWGIPLNCHTPFPGTVSVPVNAPAQVTIEVTCVEPIQLAYSIGSGAAAGINVTNALSTFRSPLITGIGAKDPAWSPDGRRIAFTGVQGENTDIYVSDADGSNRIRLTSHTAPDYRPAWSSDGSRIAFVSERDGNAEIYVVESDGTNLFRVTTYDGADIDPSWEPDGKRIAFSRSGPSAGSGIFLINADGSGAIRLTDNPLGDSQPDWAPDGARLVFRRAINALQSDLFLVNADGSELGALGAGYGGLADPDWSPDGRLIAFTQESCDWDYTFCPTQVFVARMGNGPGGVTSIATSFENVTNPSWRPAR